MNIFNKILKRDSGFDDSIGGSSDLGLPPLDQPGQQDPFASPMPQSNAQPPHQSQQDYDFNNPDMNAQMGIARPRDPAEREFGSYQGSSNTNQFQSNQAEQSSIDSKDVQIILAKLDAIKAELDSLHQRVVKIERIADADQAAAQKTQYGRW